MKVYGAAGVTEDVKLLQLPRLSLGLSKLEKINAAVLDLEPVNETAGFTQKRNPWRKLSEEFSCLF